MEKTAMQMLIELAENHTGIVNRSFWIAQAKALLPTEQQQITEAYKDGLTMGHVTGETANKSASDYFTQKYQ
jgi:hypothetical protein